MSQAQQRSLKVDPTIIYPDSDGQPMSDNTKQYECITTLHTGIEALFTDRPDVFVAADLLWYAVEGWPSIRCAPDVMVAFGRPKGHRGSYRQWVEDGVAPQVVFEVLSPGNTLKEMRQKREFYEEHGVIEYVEYDPDNGKLDVWERQGDKLSKVIFGREWHSKLLGIRLRLEGNGELSGFYPDGRKFERPVDEALAARRERERAEQASQRAEQASQRAEQASKPASRTSKPASRAGTSASYARRKPEPGDGSQIARTRN